MLPVITKLISKILLSRIGTDLWWKSEGILDVNG
jgi:hypothetical protein